MYKAQPRVDQAPTSVGVAAAGPFPSFDSRPSIVSVSTQALLGPSSVTVPSGTGYLTFPGGDGELRASPADAHPRSEAAYPIVQSFVSVVKKPEGAESKLTIAKGQPILFLPLGTPETGDATTLDEKEFIKGKNKVAADRRYQGSKKFVAIVGKNKYDDSMLLSAGYVAFAAEPTVVHFEDGKTVSDMVAIACALEYESDILATSVPLKEKPVGTPPVMRVLASTTTEHYPAGTAIMAGIFYDELDGTRKHDPARGSTFCIRACAGFPKELHDLCTSGQFVARRCATAIVPFVALPMADGEMTMVPPVRAAIIARPFPSSVM